MLIVLKALIELTKHICGAPRNGASKEEIQDMLLHSAIYSGVLATQEAFRVVKAYLIIKIVINLHT
jgi:4-carboxymuconolactone decarboxylase